MQKILISSEYFNPYDTLSCGQVFRYKQFNNGYLLVSLDKICYIYSEGDFTVIETEDKKYFENLFDLSRDYSKIYNVAVSYGSDTLKLSAK